MYKTPNNFFHKIDWELLRKQKQWLIAQSSEEAEGLLNFVDSIQDYAVDNWIVEEKTVFGKEHDHA